VKVLNIDKPQVYDSSAVTEYGSRVYSNTVPLTLGASTSVV
jgi:hypothetical protein